MSKIELTVCFQDPDPEDEECSIPRNEIHTWADTDSAYLSGLGSYPRLSGESYAKALLICAQNPNHVVAWVSVDDCDQNRLDLSGPWA